ncbi:MAG: hypothetical protein H6925_03930 [Holosporaceae bacterium]|nr:MAG: hypothetical protein H6925_03930 [Holosporaceae bacterium]
MTLKPLHTPPLSSWILFFGLLLACLFVFYPGQLSPDSLSIYAQAQAHQYSDHHPPLMGYLWHYLDLIVKGPLLMYLINLGLIWSALYILAFKIFTAQKNKLLHYYVLCIPLIPHVACYAGFVWKDLIFAYGYGLISVYLALKTMKEEPISRKASFLLGCLLFYATAVKYQAQFILPLVMGWYTYVQSRFKVGPTLLKAVPLSALFIILIHHTNQHLVTNQGQGSSNSWKYVKIYDLAGMSVRAQTVLIPTAFHKKAVTVADVESAYSFEWEPLITGPNAPFRAPITDAELKIIQSTWWQAVRAHPTLYIAHRWSIWKKGILFGVPGKAWLDQKLGKDNFISTYLVPLGILTAYVFILPFQLLFFVLGMRGLRHAHTRGAARTLLFMGSMGAMLLCVLLIFSLAAVPRYIYFTNYLFMLSVPFAFLNHQARKPE